MHFKAPYAAYFTGILIIVGLLLVFTTDLHETSFAYGSSIAGGMAAIAIMAVTVKAYKTSFLMACAALIMFVGIAYGVDEESFKDLAMKGLAGGVATGAMMYLRALLDRFNEPEEKSDEPLDEGHEQKAKDQSMAAQAVD